MFSWRTREKLTPYAFVVPTLIAIVFIYGYPLGYTAYLSFHENAFGGKIGDFSGLKNYAKIVSADYFPYMMLISLGFTFGTVIIVVSISTALALLLNPNFPMKLVARLALFVPWAMPYIATALIWQWIFNAESGIFVYFLTGLGISDVKFDVFSRCGWAIGAITGVSTWKLVPFATVMTLAALQTIPKELYEAAKIDGAGPISSFRFVTLPGIKTISGFVALLLTIWIFGRAFILIYLFTSGGPAGCTETVVIRSYLEAFQFFKPGTAAALGMIVLAISMAISAVYIRLLAASEK